MCETGNGRLGRGGVRVDLPEGEVVAAAEREGRYGLGRVRKPTGIPNRPP